jgi:hypothetical protein
MDDVEDIPAGSESGEKPKRKAATKGKGKNKGKAVSLIGKWRIRTS